VLLLYNENIGDKNQLTIMICFLCFLTLQQ